MRGEAEAGSLTGEARQDSKCCKASQLMLKTVRKMG